ncbi:hypothetical protein C1J03_22705 [Sulfitobacter sp. SK012]|nr:hypothetical protein C1J03_22705 [Sulfitobacter sp. SK012]
MDTGGGPVTWATDPTFVEESNIGSSRHSIGFGLWELCPVVLEFVLAPVPNFLQGLPQAVAIASFGVAIIYAAVPDVPLLV